MVLFILRKNKKKNKQKRKNIIKTIEKELAEKKASKKNKQSEINNVICSLFTSSFTYAIKIILQICILCGHFNYFFYRFRWDILIKFKNNFSIFFFFVSNMNYWIFRIFT